MISPKKKYLCKLFGVFSVVTFNVMAQNLQITNGTTAPQGKYPFFVAIGYTGESINRSFGGACGGALIAPNWVLTAEHCLGVMMPRSCSDYTCDVSGRTKVAIGSADLNDPTSYVVAYGTKLYFPNKNAVDLLEMNGNDIALLKIEYPLKQTHHTITLLNLATTPLQIGDTAIAIGNGTTESQGPGTMPLQEVTIPIIDDTLCKFPPDSTSRFVPGQDICAGTTEGIRQNVYGGDSGGPLLQLTKAGYYAIGVTSKITSTSRSIAAPAAFTSVPAHYAWIQNTMKANK